MATKFTVEFFDKTKITFNNKEDLFSTIDNIFNYKKPYNFFTYFGNNFLFKKGNGNFVVKREKIEDKNCDWIEYDTTYVDCLYIIYENKHKVDLKSLFESYCQSRKFNFNKKNKKYHRSSKTYKKRWYKSSSSKRNLKSGFKHEYKHSFIAKEYGVKIRSERLKEVNNFHVKYYYDEDFNRKNSSCWKDQSKNNRQYLK